MLATGQTQPAFVCTISSWAGTVNLGTRQRQHPPCTQHQPLSRYPYVTDVHHLARAVEPLFWELASLLAQVQACWVSLGFSETDHGSCPPAHPVLLSGWSVSVSERLWWVITGYKASPPNRQCVPGRRTLACSSVGEQRPLLVRAGRDTLRVEFQMRRTCKADGRIYIKKKKKKKKFNTVLEMLMFQGHSILEYSGSYTFKRGAKEERRC